MTHDTFSHTYLKPFAIYDPNTQSLKTFEDTLLLDSTAFSNRLPVSGIMLNGVLFELPKPEHRTKEQGYTSLPTPVARDHKGDSGFKDNLSAQIKLNWPNFQTAIRQWEAVLDRKAPQPLIENQKINPAFTEWLMGLPEGWITNVEISWTQKIKACGNGVVPQQAKLALSRLVK